MNIKFVDFLHPTLPNEHQKTKRTQKTRKREGKKTKEASFYPHTRSSKKHMMAHSNQIPSSRQHLHRRSNKQLPKFMLCHFFAILVLFSSLMYLVLLHLSSVVVHDGTYNLWGPPATQANSSVTNKISTVTVEQNATANAIKAKGSNDKSGSVRSASVSGASQNVTIPTDHDVLEETQTRLDCGCPKTCNDAALSMAKNSIHSCGDRIRHLMSRNGMTQHESCALASREINASCGAECDPDQCQELPANGSTVHFPSAVANVTELPMNEGNKSILPVSQDAPFDFSACLLVKDDNMILPEWLAFHYTVLPLRRLILAVDPHDSIPPEPIMDAYRKIGMNITIWRDDDFHTRKHRIVGPNATGEERYQAHRHRQGIFLTECLAQLRKENRTWTLMIDSDEYLSFNNYHSDEIPLDCAEREPGDEQNCTKQFHSDMQAGKLERVYLPIVGQPNATVAHVISGKTGVNSSVFHDFPGIYLPRVLFGPHKSTEEEVSAQVPIGFDPRSFRTLNHRAHETWQNFNPGKSIVDASRYIGRKVQNPHLVFWARSNTRNVDFCKALFRVHHYIGTMNEYTFRSGDVKRTKENFATRLKVLRAGSDDDVRGWLSEFVRLVGKEKAHELTEGMRTWAIETYGASV